MSSKKEQALVKKRSKHLLYQKAIRNGEILGMESFDTQRDLIMPRFQLAQPSTRDEGVEEGMFYSRLDGSQYKKLEVIVLAFTPTRTLWNNDTFKVVCRSRDAITGSVYGLCEECKYSKFGVSGSEPTPPECKLSYSFLCLDRETHKPFIIDLKGTSFIEGKRFLNYFMTLKKPMFSVYTTISSESQQNEKGKYFVIKLTTGKEVSPKDFELSLKIVENYRSQFISQAVPEEKEEKEKEEDLGEESQINPKEEEEINVDDIPF